MHTYRQLSEDSFEVGYFRSNGAWTSVQSFATADEAAAFASYLNGGSAPA